MIIISKLVLITQFTVIQCVQVLVRYEPFSVHVKRVTKQILNRKNIVTMWTIPLILVLTFNHCH